MRMLGIILFISCALLAQEHGAEAKAEHGAAQGEHGGGHAESTTAWKWANFAILAALLGYGISKSGGQFFRSRTAQIQNALVEARKIKEDAEARASGIDRRMASLGAEIASMEAEAKQEMAAEAQRIESDTAKLLAKIRDHARQEIESAEKQAIAELRRQASAIALNLAAEKIRSRMTPPAQDMLVDDFVRRLEAPKGSLN
jgi:F-type H+-transporting ATPase subunit b